MADFNLGIDDKPEPGSVAAVERANDPIMRYLDETVDGPQQEAQNTDTATGEAAATGESSKESAKPAANSNSSDQNNNGQQKPNQTGKEDKGKTGAPKAGDLVENGVVVAKAGAERRHYEARKLVEQELGIAKQSAVQATQQAQQMSNELANLKQTVSQINGVDPDTLNVGVKIARDLARDPLGTLRNLLTEAVAAGHNIESIGAGIDVAGIRAAIEAKYQPIVQQHQQQQNQGNVQERAVQEVTQFYTQFPDARPHDDVIAAVIEKNPQLSITEAYFQLRKAAIDRGLDWSLPLGPQMQASSEQSQQQQQNAPMPNGRSPASGANVVDASRTVVAHEDTSYGDIIKSAMRDNGLNI